MVNLFIYIINNITAKIALNSYAPLYYVKFLPGYSSSSFFRTCFCAAFKGIITSMIGMMHANKH